VLYKGTINHADGSHTELPILDCVLDMRIVITADTAVPPTGAANASWTRGVGVNMPAAWLTSAADIRDQVKEIRVYIVAQEGQQDASYTYTNPNPVTGCMGTNMVCINDTTGVQAVTVPSVNYRWKLYTLVSTPYNLK
jgi:hypothetical protein